MDDDFLPIISSSSIGLQNTLTSNLLHHSVDVPFSWARAIAHDVTDNQFVWWFGGATKENDRQTINISRYVCPSSNQALPCASVVLAVYFLDYVTAL
jgi:hypothetical protein